MKSKDDLDIVAELWSTAAKLKGIDEVLEFAQAELSEEGKMGLGQLIIEFAKSLDEVRDEFEGRDYKPTKERESEEKDEDA